MARTESRRYKTLKRAFFTQGRDADRRRDPTADCWICRQRIDYDADPGSTPESHELDHYHPVSTHPHMAEDPDNFRHAHKLCNAKRGNTAPMQGLGQQITDWW